MVDGVLPRLDEVHDEELGILGRLWDKGLNEGEDARGAGGDDVEGDRVVRGGRLGDPDELVVEELQVGLLEVAVLAEDLQVVKLIGAPGGERLDVVYIGVFSGVFP